MVVRVPAGPDELGIAEELPRVGRPEKGAERHPEDAVRVDQIGFGQWPDDHRRRVCHGSPQRARPARARPLAYLAGAAAARPAPPPMTTQRGGAESDLW